TTSVTVQESSHFSARRQRARARLPSPAERARGSPELDVGRICTALLYRHPLWRSSFRLHSPGAMSSAQSVRRSCPAHRPVCAASVMRQQERPFTSRRRRTDLADTTLPFADEWACPCALRALP